MLRKKSGFAMTRIRNSPAGLWSSRNSGITSIYILWNPGRGWIELLQFFQDASAVPPHTALDTILAKSVPRWLDALRAKTVTA